MQALGFIETRSLTASIEASDVMTKTADVWVVGTEKIGSGLVNVVIQGDVDAAFDLSRRLADGIFIRFG